jgi:hypothetical protein
MLIDANNLLQADATVIAGLLILLTIYSFKIARGIPEKEKQVRLACIIISSIIPFASSAVMLLIVDTQYMVAKI